MLNLEERKQLHYHITVFDIMFCTLQMASISGGVGGQPQGGGGGKLG